MTCSATPELLPPRKLASPLYTAVMECAPTVKIEEVYVATPAASGPKLSWVVPSKKVRVPVGVLAGEETVAVKVSEVNTTDGFAEGTSEIVGVALLTTCGLPVRERY